MTDRELLDEQVRYYRARATEYDVTSPSDAGPNAPDLELARAAVRALNPRGRVLELAAGTGLWTAILAESADDLLATDASPEMLAVNRAKLGDRPNVRYSIADAFEPPADPSHDVVFFGAFLSHVPHDRFDAFWSALWRALSPGGRVFVFDEADHGLWREDWIDQDAGIVRRTLNDGTTYRAVKVLWRPGVLRDRLQELGWRASFEASGPFYWGVVEPIVG